MLLTILIVFISLLVLLIVHELGHFLLAKKFGVAVEEFGIGYPPRIFGKKIGETIYSVNLLPLGAFVKIKGEQGEGSVEDPRNFKNKTLWQRSLIVLGGVISFWLMAFLVLSTLTATVGIPTAIPDDVQVKNAWVQIIKIAQNSPAEKAGLKEGDFIIKIKAPKSETRDIKNIGGLQELVQKNLGKNLTLTIKRAKKIFKVKVFARSNPPENQGPIGVSLVRVTWQKTPFYKAPFVGASLTIKQTIAIPLILGDALKKKLTGKKVEGISLAGPIGVGQIMSRAWQRGIGSFLFLFSMIAIWLAFFNSLPIPALDGGRLLFLIIEAVRKKPVSVAIEQKITNSVFIVLVFIMILITIKDIISLF